ncbi:hypothetical protein QTI66_32210 [Variovorax sp. J22R133]|uniref:hypothetical protein n=1 Tax=Variovorax brevis TaxID=3053503 RepID=UPI002578051F|nr:hypothetical protein [Variovorax sp. J22R133]MDM0116801.1 hypothetical protein [Variovorax sp. J22R133]
MISTSIKVIERIPLARPATGLVECIVQEAAFQELVSLQRLIHELFIAPDVARLDRAWNWPRYLTASYLLNDLHGRLTEAFQIVVSSPTGRAVPVGLAMLVSGYPHPGEAGEMSTFVWFLTSAPAAALRAFGVTDRFVVMPLLLDTAVQASRWQGLHGRVALHADHRGTPKQQDDLVKRYLACGLTRRNHLKGSLLSRFRRMDDRYFAYDIASAHACTLKWDPLR